MLSRPDESATAGAADVRLDVSGLPAGVYMVLLDLDGVAQPCIRVAVAR